MESSLSPDDRSRISELYNERFRKYGVHHRTVGWGSGQDQKLRFSVLCRGLDLTGKRILDVGCGLGELVPFLQQRHPGGFSYCGIDIATDLLKKANEMFGGPNVEFRESDILSLDETESFDAALLSGALSFRIADNMQYSRATMEKLFRMTNDVVALNFLTSYVDFQEERNFHYAPEEMFAIGKSLTRYVTLIHDYPLWEFTLQLLHKSVNESPEGC